MPWWGWVLIWVGLSFVFGPIAARLIRRSAEYYPTPDEYEKIKVLAEREERQRKAGLN